MDTVPGSLEELLVYFKPLAPLLDSLPDVVFFVKDEHARYVMVNKTLVKRCGHQDKEDILNRCADEVFPARFGDLYTEQDRTVLRASRHLHNRLELHLYPRRYAGWCLTSKQALVSHDGKTLGLMGISRDLQAPEASQPVYQRLASVAHAIEENYTQSLNLSTLAEKAHMSPSQLIRYFRKVFHITPGQMLCKARLNAAIVLLESEDSIADIATNCGYADHSAFTRQFRSVAGLTPSQYRSLLRDNHTPPPM